MSLASDLIQRVQIGMDKLAEPVAQSVGEASEFIRKNPVTSAVGVGGGVIVGSTITQIIRKKRKASTSTKKKKSKTRKSKPKKRSKVSKKRKTTKSKRKPGKKKIRMTKKGQPYIILPNGRAKFISKSSASRRRKLKGGYY